MNSLGNFEANLHQYAATTLEDALTLHTVQLRSGKLWLARFGIARTDELARNIRSTLHGMNPKYRMDEAIHVAPCIMGTLQEPEAPGVALWSGSPNAELHARDAGVSFLGLIIQQGDIRAVQSASSPV